MLIQKSTFQLLRFHFSYFLMPVFWFALSFVKTIHFANAVQVFLLLHLLLYPSSNGYNSYMDRDSSSIGGLKNPLQPTRQLLAVTWCMDIACVLLALFISPLVAACFFIYIVFSRAYSSRNIRLKKYPVLGYLVVVFNQGCLVFLTVYIASAATMQGIPWTGVCIAGLLIGGFYPITQVYQHQEDAADGVRTISMLLGKNGTFLFCAFIYFIAFVLLYLVYTAGEPAFFLVAQLFFIPVVIYFISWYLKVKKDPTAADFSHTMKMNILASTCTNLAFITVLILNQLD